MENNLRILLVEDSPDDATLVLRELTKHGYNPVYERVETRDSMNKALEMKTWDIVISDYILPGFSGLDVLKLLKGKNLDVPCIITSGRIDEETAVEAMRAGAKDYIMKDNLKRLGPAVERELADAQVRRERALAEEQKKALSSRLLVVQEEERRTIARELHDEIGQSLTALKLMLTQISRSRPESVETLLNETQSVITELIRQVREMSLKLRPSMLDDLGLLPTLLWHFERYTTQTGIKVNFKQQGMPRNFSPEINTAVYRIVQEGLTNVARYAKTNEVNVSIVVDDNSINLKVEDHGCGFDSTRRMAKTNIGLSGMRERAQSLGGKMKIETRPGKGTCFTVELPISGK
jgi:signal transduction histidine kinase